jgi:hypothetical protein
MTLEELAAVGVAPTGEEIHGPKNIHLVQKIQLVVLLMIPGTVKRGK